MVGPYMHLSGGSAWEMDLGVMSIVPVSDKVSQDWYYGFTQEQADYHLSEKFKKKLAAEGFIVYEIEVENFKVFADQVAFDPETATILSDSEEVW